MIQSRWQMRLNFPLNWVIWLEPKDLSLKMYIIITSTKTEKNYHEYPVLSHCHTRGHHLRANSDPLIPVYWDALLQPPSVWCPQLHLQLLYCRQEEWGQTLFSGVVFMYICLERKGFYFLVGFCFCSWEGRAKDLNDHYLMRKCSFLHKCISALTSE